MLLAAFTFNWLWLAEVLIFVALYATLAASLNLVTGYAGMFSLGHHGFFAVGAYAAAWFTNLFPGTAAGSAAGWAIFLGSAAAAGLAATVAGLLVGIPCLRLRGDYLAIATLAFGEIVRIVIQNTKQLGGSEGLYVPRVLMEPRGADANTTFRNLVLAVAVVLLVGTLVVIRNLVRSAHGRAIVSLREDEIASELLGVRTTRYKVGAFALGATFAGLGGWLYAHYLGSIAPANFDLFVGIKILLIVVLGGLGSLSGTVFASFVLIGIERLLLTGVFGDTWKEWMQVEYAVLLILLMLLRPNGIFGSRELSEVFRRRAKGGRDDARRRAASRSTHLCRSFGGLKAVADVCFEIDVGEIVALIGPNGAGKTTCFNLVTGADCPTSGERPVRRRRRCAAGPRGRSRRREWAARFRTFGFSRR